MKALVALLALAAACAPPAPLPHQLFGEPLPASCGSGVDPGCAAQIADRLVIALKAEELPDPAVVAYVRGVGARLTRADGIAEPIRIEVLDDLSVDAEALSGGVIHLTRGALLRLRSEAELAALIAHELGHAIAGHEAPNRPAGIRRDDEIQADELAVRLVAAAGYDPRAVELMLRAIGAEQPVPCEPDPTDPHPCVRDRIARVRARIGEHPRGELGVAAFRAGTATLVSGEDPRRALRTPRGILFAHAGLAFEPPADLAAQLQILDGRAAAALPGDVTLVVSDVPRALALALQAHPPAGQAFAVGERGALWILVAGAPSAQAAALARAVRPATAADLAAVHPARFDLAAPRALWPE